MRNLHAHKVARSQLPSEDVLSMYTVTSSAASGGGLLLINPPLLIRKYGSWLSVVESAVSHANSVPPLMATAVRVDAKIGENHKEGNGYKTAVRLYSSQRWRGLNHDFSNISAIGEVETGLVHVIGVPFQQFASVAIKSTDRYLVKGAIGENLKNFSLNTGRITIAHTFFSRYGTRTYLYVRVLVGTVWGSWKRSLIRIPFNESTSDPGTLYLTSNFEKVDDDRHLLNKVGVRSGLSDVSSWDGELGDIKLTPRDKATLRLAISTVSSI